MNIFLPLVFWKQCSKKEKCVNPFGCWLPETAKYFPRAKWCKNGLRSVCRFCDNARQNKSARQWRKDHQVRALERDLATRTKYREPARLRSQEWRQTHPEQSRATARKYAKTHPREVKLGNQQRRTLKRKLPMEFTIADWENALEFWNGCCTYCGNTVSLFDRYPALHQDHFIPLSSSDCPGTVSWNMLPACQTCNLSKHDHDPEQWLISRFGKRKAKIILARIHAYFDWVRQQDG